MLFIFIDAEEFILVFRIFGKTRNFTTKRSLTKPPFPHNSIANWFIQKKAKVFKTEPIESANYPRTSLDHNSPYHPNHLGPPSGANLSLGFSITSDKTEPPNPPENGHKINLNRIDKFDKFDKDKFDLASNTSHSVTTRSMSHNTSNSGHGSEVESRPSSISRPGHFEKELYTPIKNSRQRERAVIREGVTTSDTTSSYGTSGGMHYFKPNYWRVPSRKGVFSGTKN